MRFARLFKHLIGIILDPFLYALSLLPIQTPTPRGGVLQADMAHAVNTLLALSKSPDCHKPFLVSGLPFPVALSGPSIPQASSSSHIISAKACPPNNFASQGTDCVQGTSSNPPHLAAALATKWMNSYQLSQFAQREGAIIKKGKFSLTEEGQVNDAIKHYQTVRLFIFRTARLRIHPS